MSSNPFLDPPPPSAKEEEEEENGGGAPGEPPQHPALSKTNPFYQDLLAEPHGHSGVQQLSRPDSDTLIDFASGLNDHAHGDGSLGVLLDVSDGGMVGPHSSSSSAATATDGAQSNGGVDLLGSNFTQFGESGVNIPPPMEFSDFGNHQQHHDHQHHAPLEPSDDSPATATSPVTNIDDLLGVEFSANGGLPPPATAAATTTEPARNGATDDGTENGFDFLLDAEEAREQPPAASLADITEEELPRLPPGPPPPVPAAEPPPSPAAPVPAEEFLADGTDPSEASATTSVFLPSENPMDNITMISVCPERSEAAGNLSGSSSKNNNNNNNNTVHVTDITVTSPTPKVSAVNVTRPKPAPRGRDGGQDSKAPAGTAVVTVGQPTTPNVTQIRFDTSTSETFIRSTLPPNTFVPTTVGITKAIKKPISPRRSQAVAGEVEEKEVEEEEEEEEPITPMMVHRDHRGNKLAAPSPPESLGRQTNVSRAVDGEAKRDLHDIMAQMTKSTRGLPLARNGAAAASEDEEPAVAEDEIVPVQLSRKETETAQAVLSKWLSEEPKASSPSSSVSKAASPAKKSGFQKAVGTLIDVQSGKVELPSGSVFLNTMGVTKTPKKKGASQEEEVEEAITPMAVHKDHLGNKHYAPSPPESLGKRSGVRKLDSAAKEDIAAILSGMPPRSVGARKSAAVTEKETEPAVAEDAIVATVLSKEEERVAMDAVARWMSGDSGPPPPRPKPSPFQRLVNNAMDSSAAAAANKTETDEAGKEASRDPVSDKADGVTVSDSVPARPEAAVELVVEPSRSSSTASAHAPAPPSEPEEPPSSSSSETPRQKPAPPPTSPKPLSPQQVPPPSKPTMADRRTLFEQPDQTPLAPTRKEPGPKVTRIEIGAKAGTTTTATTTTATISSSNSSSAPATAAEPKPVPSQRSLRSPAKFGSLSQASSLTVKPLSMKIGSLSVGSRGLPAVGSSSLSSSLSSSSVSSKLPAKVEYGKVRTDEAPFLVEVLKGILGLGIKVKVNGEGHVEVTEVQRNSPVDKNGNVKVGDYVLCVNTTELRGLTEGRVQQVLRLLPRGLVKLVVSTRPPPSSAAQGGDAAGQSSLRAGGAYTQYGVRLSPLPFSPTPFSDGQVPPLTSPLTLPPDEAAPASTTTTTTTDSATTAATTTTTTTTPVTQPLTVSVADEEEEDDDEMATRKLSKALSPRSQAAAAAAKPYSPEPVSPPKPAPRQRAGVPTSLSTPRSDSSADEVEDAGRTSPRKAERKMTASEIVAAASRRPSGRDEDLPQPAPVQKEAGGDSPSGSPRPSSSSSSSSGVDPVVAAARSPRGVASPREEVLPVFAEAAKKVSPVATPRTRPRSPAEGSEGPHTPTENHRHDDHHHLQELAKTEPESQAERKPEVVAEVVHAHAVTITQTAPPPLAAAASKAKVPPPVAPKPRRTSSVSSDKSASSAHSDESPKDLPSPTLVSSKLRDFADAGVPTAEEQAQNRKFVSSAARMFERKASESKTVSPLAHGPAKSSVSVSSVVRSFNRDPEPADPSGRSGGVAMRKISLGVGGGGGTDGGRSINSALRPASERRKSMPSSFTGSATPSLSLTKPIHLLSQYRNNPPSSGRGAPEAQPEKAPRFSSALRPRQHGAAAAAASASSSSSSSSAHNTTSLRSVLASKERKHVEEEQEEEEEEENEEALEPATPPAVGKIAESPKVTSARSDVTLRSRSSVHDSHDASTSRSHKHASWSPQSADDPHSPKMIFTSSSLRHHSDRHGSPTSQASPFSSPSSSSSAPWRSDQSDNLESTMKKFDDLLSDKHTFDSDDELPTVSNSVSFDLLKSRSAGKVAASMKTSEEPVAAEATPRGDSVPAPAVASRDESAKDERSPGEGKSGGSTDESADQAQAAARAEEAEEDLPVKDAPAPSTGEMEAAEASAEPSRPQEEEEVSRAAVAQPVSASPKPAKREEEPEKGSEVQREEEPAESESEIPEAVSEQRQPLPDAEKSLAEATPAAVVPEVPEAKAVDSVPSDSGEQGESAETGKADDHMAETSQQKGQGLKRADAEDVEDAYPEEDGAAPLDVVDMAADSYPDEDSAAPMPAAAEETLFQQQASSIVQTVLSNALSDAADMLKRGVDINVQQDEDDNDDDAPPPPLPSEEPPPLPGAPPPPLILRNDAEKLVNAEDLVGMLPSQEAASAKTSPRSSEERTSSAEASPRGGQPSADVVESDDVEVDVDDAVKADTSAPSFALPVDQTEEVPVPPPQDVRNRNDEPQTLTRSSDDVVISFDTAPPSDSLDPLSVNTDLLSGGGGVLRGKDGELEHAHSDNPPVSDTLSQDSGVQDEDMSEDGLRFSQDESPTSNVDSSVFDAALTPDEIPVSVMHGSEEDGRAGSEEAGVEGGAPVSAKSEEAGVGVDVEHVTVTQSPVPSPRVTLSQARPGAPPSQAPTPTPPPTLTPAAIQTPEVGSPPPTTDAQSVHASLPQDSASPRCSSGPQEAAVSAPPGGASTNGDDGRRAGDSALGVRAAEGAAVAAAVEENYVQSFTVRNHGANDEVEEKGVQAKDRDGVRYIPKSSNINTSSVGRRSSSRAPVPPQSPPPPLPPSTPPQEDVHDEDEGPQEDSSPDSPAEVVSSRKWCILDQSGSLFLHGGSGARVSVAKATLRQVSSMRPAELASMLEAANRDLDEAKLPKALELRVVSARGLNGRAVKVDVTQREDYFVQVTNVISKDSSLQEADLLLAVDGRTLRNRRPAQVHVQIDGTGPKGVLLTARGVKLPPSVVRQREGTSEDSASTASGRAPSPSVTGPASSSPTSPKPAVEVSPGVYDVIMLKGATGVGFCLEGGKASPRGDLPILIKRIFKGGPAEKCGQLKVKDEIISVNGVDFTNMRHYEAWNHLKFLDDGEIHLRIRREQS